jgi:hypothetical protein
MGKLSGGAVDHSTYSICSASFSRVEGKEENNELWLSWRPACIAGESPDDVGIESFERKRGAERL